MARQGSILGSMSRDSSARSLVPPNLVVVVVFCIITLPYFIVEVTSLSYHVTLVKMPSRQTAFVPLPSQILKKV